MKTHFKLPLIQNNEARFRAQLGEASRLSGKSGDAILQKLDVFVERTMKHLDGVDRKSPMKGYAAAFHAALAASTKAAGKRARDLLRGFFYPQHLIFHLRTYPPYPHLPQGGKAGALANEKCRAAYLPSTDVGPLLAKNVDDPIRNFKPSRSFVPPKPAENHVVTDGTGSGLHFDEEPPDFFPVDYATMLHTVCKAARGATEAVEMLENLSSNWGGANVLLFDKGKGSARIDKCSYNRFAAKVNAVPCMEHISGMVCQDPAYKEYQRSLRQAYLDSVGGDWSGYEGVFWEACDLKETVLADGLKRLEPQPTYDGLLKLFTRHEKPGHLCKHGEPVVQGEPTPGEYTLQRNFYVIEKNEYHRWQWDVEKNLPTCQTPREVFPLQLFAS
ncbi:MAG: hypothetical protein HY360_02020 [Verrucomicrobia bacterium]|nr:hypothetical protein [Verrucomicrobiota bacterium]